MYQRIMVPLDGSRFAESALPQALSLSRRTGASLHLVTVQEPLPTFAYAESEDATHEWSGQYLESVKARSASLTEASVTSGLRTGRVAEELEIEAGERDVDLVVMASHGRGLLSRAWLGSVADAFVRLADRPILLVRPHDGDPPDLDADWETSRILVPLDGTDLSEAVLDLAVELGAHFGARFNLLRIVPYPVDVATPYLPHTVQMNQSLVDEARTAALEYLDGHAERLGLRDLEVDIGVEVDAQPGHGILKHCESRGCDLIAMSTHGRTGLSRAVLGSAADKVLRGTHVPLLIYRPGKPSGQPGERN